MMMLDIINVKYFYLKFLHIVLFYVERATIAPFTYILTILEIFNTIFIGIVFLYIVWTIYFYVYSYTKDIQKNTSEVKLELSLFFIFVIFISIIYYWDFKIFDYFTIFDNTIFDNKIAFADSGSESNTPNLNKEKPKPTTSDLLKYGWTSGLAAGIFAGLFSVVGTNLGYELSSQDIFDVSFIVFNGNYSCIMWINHGWNYAVGSSLAISAVHIGLRSQWTPPGNPPGNPPGTNAHPGTDVKPEVLSQELEALPSGDVPSGLDMPFIRLAPDAADAASSAASSSDSYAADAAYDQLLADYAADAASSAASTLASYDLAAGATKYMLSDVASKWNNLLRFAEVGGIDEDTINLIGNLRRTTDNLFLGIDTKYSRSVAFTTAYGKATEALKALKAVNSADNPVLSVILLENALEIPPQFI